MKITRNRKCRICKSAKLEKFLALGKVAFVSSFLKKEQLNQFEQKPDLNIYVCTNCWLAQVIDVPDPTELFLNNYPYFTSVISTMITHFNKLAYEITERFSLNNTHLVVDIGSNDGVFLNGFKKLGVTVLGIEPAPNIASVAVARDIETLNIFFTDKTAKKIRKERGSAKVILSTNTFAHIDDLDDFCLGLNNLLDDEGVFIFENPYLVDTLFNNEFDTMYYDHVSYYAISPLKILFKKFNMEIFDVQQTPVHGGSILVFVKKIRSKIPLTKAPQLLINLEQKLELNTLKPYYEFAKRVKLFKEKFTSLLRSLKNKNKRIVGYGASARGNVLLSYCQIGTETLDYMVDKSTFKQGLYAPGTHIPIFAPEKILEDMPDYLLIVAWNFADEIIKQQREYRKRGGKFIIPIPEIKII